MPTPDESGAPLTFDLKKDLLERLHAFQTRSGARSLSEVVRQAVARHDFRQFSAASEHQQISVRLPTELKAQLLRLARQKKASVGELLRSALDALAGKRTKGANSPKTKTATMAKKKTTKKVAKKKKK
ncbi:MAG: ribbon-helix-helix protein, CopG family [Opitutales bacterium]